MLCYAFNMISAEYTLRDVAVVFPQINTRTIQVWVKRGVIRPSVESSGQGFPVRFDYLNLVEIGLVWQLIRIGVDSHAFFSKLMDQARKYSIRWIGGQQYSFNCFFVCPEASAFARRLDEKESQDYIEAPLFVLLDPEKIGDFFKVPGWAAGWLLVDVRTIQYYVEEKLSAI